MARIHDIYLQRKLFGQKITGLENGNPVYDGVHETAMTGVFSLTDVFEFVINGFC
jgi:hypothetical protein